MKILDIAIKDVIRAFRSAFAIVFMFGIPILVTGMFYLMFGNIASNGEFSLPRTKVVVVNLDQGGPKFQISTKNIPGGGSADTMGDLVISVLESDEMSELIELSKTNTTASARQMVDSQNAQVAIVIPEDFSQQFADPDGQASIEFYQDPTLTIGPDIIRTILNRFMDGMASVKIAVNVFLDEAHPEDLILAGQFVENYLDISLVEADDLEAELIELRAPVKTNNDEEENLLIAIISPVMGGMMIFYAFFTGSYSAQNILKEEEEGTLPRLFTTPTPQASILTGKFLAVFLTVFVQIIVLLIAARLIFGIQWGNFTPVALFTVGTVFLASSFGILINSFLKSTKQGGVIFGGLLTITGMLGLIRIFAPNSPASERLGNSVSLLVPQGWALRGLLNAMNDSPLTDVLTTTVIMLAISLTLFSIGVLRFNRRYI